MIKTRTLLSQLARAFPKRLAKQYHDYVGHMLGTIPETVHKVVLVLDMDATIAEEVIAAHPDLILTHHPFIYGTRAKVFKADPARKALTEKLESAGLCLYSFHTNFDEGQGGMNDALAAALNLSDIHPLAEDPMARAGTLSKPMEVHSFAKYAKKQLNINYGLLIAAGKPIVSTVAIVGGGGSHSWGFAKQEGIDLFISGDMPHHLRRGVVVEGYDYLDLPHEIEKIFMPTMKAILLKLDPTLEVVIIDHEKEPEVI